MYEWSVENVAFLWSCYVLEDLPRHSKMINVNEVIVILCADGITY